MKRPLIALYCLLLIASGITVSISQGAKGATSMPKAIGDAKAIQSIGFRSVSKDWSAYVTYYADGRVDGAHLAGNPPFVHQDKATISKAAVKELWQAAKLVGQKTFPKDPRPDPKWTTYEQIDLNLKDEAVQIMYETSPVKQDPGPEVKQLLEIILKYHIGGW